MSFEKETRIVMQKRRKMLHELKKTVEKRLKNAPDGSIRISRGRGKTEYYLRTDPKDKGGKYITVDKKELAVNLVQKGYDRKLLKAADLELRAIESFLRSLPDTSPEEVYSQLYDARKELVTPYFEPDDVYIRRWQNVPFRGNSFNPGAYNFLTDRGEKVRSKSEMIIANLLNKARVPYRYECPLELEDNNTVFPDFTVLNVRLRKELYWEHEGMMGNEKYAGKAIRKLRLYQANGYFPGDQIILTIESENCPIDVEQISETIQYYLL